MTDINGKTINVGDSVRFKPGLRDTWLNGTVRATREASYYNGFEQRIDVMEAKVDDGDPKDPDVMTNGFHVAAWVEGDWIEVLSADKE